MKKTDRVRIAVIGCGAVSERCHLPALSTLKEVDVAFLVDRDDERARQLAGKFDVPSVSQDYREVFGRVDAAVLALPHHLHEPVGLDMLEQGIHVLVEKPMAMTSEGCRAMVAAARKHHTILAVGHMRRFLYAANIAKEMIAGEMLGAIESFDVREGNVYNWPVHSGFFFHPSTAGGGVLLDTGAHTLDLLRWWLGGLSLEGYCDDNYGGVEADCEIQLATSSGARGLVELSRTRNLRNTAIIRGERGTIEIALRSNELHLSIKEGRHLLSGGGRPAQPGKEYGQTFVDLFVPQAADFVRAVQRKTPPKVSGEEAAETVALIEQCYRQRCCLKVPGILTGATQASPSAGMAEYAGQTILVTGATGFIGGRLVEHLVLHHKAKVKVLVRNFKNASRIARFPVEMISGDIIDPQTVFEAAAGCRYIFHCAYDFAGSPKHKEDVAVKGTENICRAALAHHVERLVHVSTFSVYGETPAGQLTEDCPKQDTADIYARTKQAAEEMVLKYARQSGLPAVVIQPTIVYGPYSRPWTIGPLEQLQKGRVALVDGGNGLCNAVYIDDVIDAMILAAVKDRSNGEVFLISGREPVSWKTFYQAFETLIGSSRTVSLTDSEIEELRMRKQKQAAGRADGIFRSLWAIIKDQSLWEKVYNIPRIKTKAEWFKGKYPRGYDHIITKFLGLSRTGALEKPAKQKPEEKAEDVLIPDPIRQALLRSQTSVCIEKARKTLGYQPRYSFEQGMTVVHEFLKWGNYLN